MLPNTYRELIFLSFLYRCRANAHIKHHEGFSPYMIFKSHTTARQTVFRWWWQSRSRISMSASTLDRNARTSILVQPNAFPKVTQLYVRGTANPPIHPYRYTFASKLIVFIIQRFTTRLLYYNCTDFYAFQGHGLRTRISSYFSSFSIVIVQNGKGTHAAEAEINSIACSLARYVNAPGQQV